MDKQTIIENFSQLGKFMSQFNPKGFEKEKDIPHNNLFYESLKTLIERSKETNPWFTEENVLHAFGNWAKALTRLKLEKWLKNYTVNYNKPVKNIGIIMAGNIPLVGFHDMLSVLASGHKAIVKLSKHDKHFIPLLVKYLEHLNPDWKNRVQFTDGILKNIDAVIATGSNNTARYFEYYFGKYPHIIRKNRNSVAVLTGKETTVELQGLMDDIFLYFGLGCRNVSKIFVPENYDFNLLFEASLKYKHYIEYEKYRNNFVYNKAVFIMSTDENEKKSLLENGLFLLKKDFRYASPIGVVFYEEYNNISEVEKILQHSRDQIQVIVSHVPQLNAIPFGKTQQPELWDYADGVDTMKFLLNL